MNSSKEGQRVRDLATGRAGGTPKLTHWCSTCEDWGTIVIGDLTSAREEPCPDHTPPPCRCGDGRAVEVPLADSVLIADRVCLVHPERAGGTR